MKGSWAILSLNLYVEKRQEGVLKEIYSSLGSFNSPAEVL